MLLAFPWHDNADRILLGHRSREFPVHAGEEAWDALEEGWWAWVKADGAQVYIAECNGNEDRPHPAYAQARPPRSGTSLGRQRGIQLEPSATGRLQPSLAGRHRHVPCRATLSRRRVDLRRS